MNVWIPVPAWTVVGNEVVFGINGPRMVAIAEHCERVPVLSISAAQGSVLDAGVWDTADSDLDATIAAGPPSPAPKSAAAVLNVEYDCSAGPLFDARGVFGVNTLSGQLVVQAKNPATGMFDTIGTFVASGPRTAYRIENVPGAVYYGAGNKLVLRYRFLMSGPLVAPAIPTGSLPSCQVTVHS
jgi:hypothetical protein